MATRERCGSCGDYETKGHNYCRMCGFHLTKGYVRNVKVAEAYNTSERYCGYCGGPKYKCACRVDPPKRAGN